MEDVSQQAVNGDESQRRGQKQSGCENTTVRTGRGRSQAELPGATTLRTSRTLHGAFAWQLVPAKPPMRFSSWGSSRFASFALSLTFSALSSPFRACALCVPSWSLAPRLLCSGGERRQAASAAGSPGHRSGRCLSARPCGTGCLLALSLRAWVPDVKEVTVTRKSPLLYNITVGTARYSPAPQDKKMSKIYNYSISTRKPELPGEQSSRVSPQRGLVPAYGGEGRQVCSDHGCALLGASLCPSAGGLELSRGNG